MLASRARNLFLVAVEGVLKNDKMLADGNYYNTLVMGRWHDGVKESRRQKARCE
ncbi:hypothetical protein ABRZ24_11145 [Brenneria populi]|uniref:Uncharacterized protein n=1 Tax=Brenneria populi TaxID=1505588 RepID=A0ABU6JRB6_9GAMM|nr:hypothetical protein [Brenneria populi Li et al. 2015]